MTWTIPVELEKQIISECTQGFPLESCGLFLGPINDDGTPTGAISKIWPAHNAEESARLYSVDPKDMFEANRFGVENNLEIVGVYHSHTHSQAYPSPTDVAQAIDSRWCYAICSLAMEKIEIKYYLLSEDEVTELECEKV